MRSGLYSSGILSQVFLSRTNPPVKGANGLIVHTANAETKTLWKETARTFYADLRGDFVPADIFDRVVSLSDSIRSVDSVNTSGH